MFDFNLFQWLLDGLGALWGAIRQVGFDGIAWLITHTLPDPAGMPQLPGSAAGFLENAGWLSVLIDFGLINDLIEYTIRMYMVLGTFKAGRAIRGWW